MGPSAAWNASDKLRELANLPLLSIFYKISGESKILKGIYYLMQTQLQV